MKHIFVNKEGQRISENEATGRAKKQAAKELKESFYGLKFGKLPSDSEIELGLDKMFNRGYK